MALPGTEDEDTMQRSIAWHAYNVARCFLTASQSLGSGHAHNIEATHEEREDLVSAINESYARFCTWAGNMGALQPADCTESLDYRLREEDDGRTRVCDLLVELATTLDQVVVNTTGSSTNGGSAGKQLDQHGTDELIAELLDLETSSKCTSAWIKATVADLIGRLFKLSLIIEKSTTRDRYATAEARFGSLFPDTFDLAYVNDKFGGTNALQAEHWLLRRLGKAITKRRMFLKYSREHQEKIVRPVENDESGAPTKAAPILPPILNIQRIRVFTHYGTQSIEQTTASTLGEMDFSTPHTGFDDEERSLFSEATSIDDGQPATRRRVINLTDIANVGEPFECPYCCKIQNFNGQTSWKKHVFADLRAYVCTFKECGMLMFTSKSAWIDHEMAMHRRRWLCHLCSITPFSNKPELMAHLQKTHNTPEDATTSALVAATSSQATQIPMADCRLCDWSSTPEHGASERSGEVVWTVPYRKFMKHLGGHLEDLALFAAPLDSPLDCDEEESAPGSDDAARADSSGRSHEVASSVELPPLASSKNLDSTVELSRHHGETPEDSTLRSILEQLGVDSEKDSRDEHFPTLHRSAVDDFHPVNRETFKGELAARSAAHEKAGVNKKLLMLWLGNGTGLENASSIDDAPGLEASLPEEGASADRQGQTAGVQNVPLSSDAGDEQRASEALHLLFRHGHKLDSFSEDSMREHVPTAHQPSKSFVIPEKFRVDAKGVLWITLWFEDPQQESGHTFLIRGDIETVNVDRLGYDLTPKLYETPPPTVDTENAKHRLEPEPPPPQVAWNRTAWALASLNPALRGNYLLMRAAVYMWRLYYGDVELQETPELTDKSSRDRRACDFCREMRATCHLLKGMPCEVCLQLGVACTYEMSTYRMSSHSIGQIGLRSLQRSGLIGASALVDGHFYCQWIVDSSTCGQLFSDAGQLNDHIESDHMRGAAQTFACSWKGCKLDSFPAFNKLARHVHVHTGYKPFRCRTCQQGFATRDQLDTHKTTHISTEEFVCHWRDCGRSFAVQNDLDWHINSVHFNAMPKPRHADDTYTKIVEIHDDYDDFWRTRRLPTPPWVKHGKPLERPEKCPIPTCHYSTKGFARKHDRDQHALTHYNGILVCSFCPDSSRAAEKEFGRVDIFKRHLASEHGVERRPPETRDSSSKESGVPGICSTCRATFASAQLLYDHLDDCTLNAVGEQLPASTASNA